MDQRPTLAYMVRMHLGTWLLTCFKGHLVGTDATGNNYYEERAIRPNGRARRWIIYKGPVEASAVPPEWHCLAALHHRKADPGVGAPALEQAAHPQCDRHARRLPAAGPRL